MYVIYPKLACCAAAITTKTPRLETGMVGSAELVTMRQLGANPMIRAADGDSERRGSDHASAVDGSFGSSATGASLQQVWPCPPCRRTLQSLRALADRAHTSTPWSV